MHRNDAVIIALQILTIATKLHDGVCHAFSHRISPSSFATGESASFTQRSTLPSTKVPPRRSCHTNNFSMKLKIGTLGLPNVGKSTLFNAMAQQSLAQAANFPFCTIDPNVTPIAIPDLYLEKLGQLVDSTKTIPATIEWLDVAGLAKGAHRGEGLGNRFLGTLRECRALCHLTRAFDDESVVHVDGKVDPVGDIEAIGLELLLADEAHVERRLERKDKVPEEERAVLEKVANGLALGKPARSLQLTKEEQFHIRGMGLLTLKPVIHAFNVDECDYLLDREATLEHVQSEILSKLEFFDPSTDAWSIVSAKVESEMVEKSPEELQAYLESLGVEEDFDRTQLSYHQLPLLVAKILDLKVIYTGPGVPPERSRTTKAHLLSGTLTAEGLAGRIHGEIEKGFIRAEVIQAQSLLEHDSYNAAKDRGSIRMEGRDYELQNNDVVCIKWK